jgi:RNA polymerase sigma-70 factor (ECF subfamily)
MVRKGTRTMTGHDDLIRAFASIRTSTLGYLRTIVRDPHMAEDLFQETWVVVMRKIDSFDPTGDFGAWVRTIALNLARNELRKKKHLRPMPPPAVLESLEQAHASQSMRDLKSSSERLAYLDQCLEKLDARQRSLLDHRYSRGASLLDIASRCGRSPGAVQVALARVRQALLRCIEGEQKRAAVSHG